MCLSSYFPPPNKLELEMFVLWKNTIHVCIYIYMVHMIRQWIHFIYIYIYKHDIHDEKAMNTSKETLYFINIYPLFTIEIQWITKYNIEYII